MKRLAVALRFGVLFLAEVILALVLLGLVALTFYV